MKSINQIYFSPTHTTEKIVKAVSNNMKLDRIIENDITFSSIDRQFTDTDLVITGVPVYAGRIPDVVRQRMEGLRGNNTPAIIIVVYGNREYDDALLELSDLMKDKGFKVISGAAFIGEHSFSSDLNPLAVGRPDADDLAVAAGYGETLSKITDWKAFDPGTLIIPGKYPYKEKKASSPVSPVTGNKCQRCMKCISACPVGAIEKSKPDSTDEKKCIKCCACIKVCDYGARYFENENILKIAARLFENCRKRKEPELIF